MKVRNASFPQGLKALLDSKFIIKIGQSVEGDLKHIYKDYGTPYNGFMELHHLCYEVGLLFSPGKDSSQAALTAMVLGKHLPEGDVRTSNRDDAVVSLNSSEYATYLELRMDLMIELVRNLENQYDVASLSGIFLIDEL